MGKSSYSNNALLFVPYGLCNAAVVIVVYKVIEKLCGYCIKGKKHDILIGLFTIYITVLLWKAFFPEKQDQEWE